MVFRRILDTASRMLPAVTGARLGRRIHRVPGRAEIAIRGAHLPEAQDMVAHLEARLNRIKGVHRAEVNAVLGTVMLFLDDDEESLDDDVLEAVEEAESRYGRENDDFAEMPRPGDERAMAVEALLAGTAFAGSGLALVAGFTGLPRLSPLLPTVLALADTMPQARSLLNRVVGETSVDAVTTAGGLLAQSLAQ